jgi:hypothetical protein
MLSLPLIVSGEPGPITFYGRVAMFPREQTA